MFTCCVHPGRSEGSPGETGDRERGLGGELYEEAGLCEILTYLCLFSLLVHYLASMCIGDCVYVPVRACVRVRMCVYMCVYPNHIAPLHRKPPYWLKRGNYERICDLKEIK